MKITKYPDGQLSAKGSDLLPETKDGVLKIRLSSWDDMQKLLVIAAALRRMDANPEVFIPYIFGSRSDRSFESSGINYVKEVIAPLLNAQNFKRISTMDPHSLALENAIDNLVVSQLTLHLQKRTVLALTDNFEKPISIVCPDNGAYKKTWALCEALNSWTEGKLEIDFVHCEKIRNLQGQITHTKVSHSPKFDTALIVDDICDGGRTFLEIAKTPEFNKKMNLNLWVTHGIFSKGLKELAQKFDHIFTTNSVQDINSMEGFGWENEKYLHKLTQYKVV